MEERNVITVKSITGKLIGSYFLYGILWGILYSIIYAKVSQNFSGENSLIPIAMFAIILQGIIAFFLWRNSITSVFKKVTINKNDVKDLIKNLIIFSVVMCLISAGTTWIEMNDKIDETIENSLELRMAENYIKYFYNDEQIAEYNAQKEKIINETKTRMNTYFIVLEIGILIVNIGAVPLQKNYILKYCEEENI